MSDRIPTALRLCPLRCGRRFRELKPENLRDSIAWHMVMAHGATQQARYRPQLRVIDGGRS
jgi:hypothetical protein